MSERSAADRRRPFLKMPIRCLTECARIAPSASATGNSPNRIPSGSAPQHPNDLRHDCDRDLNRTTRTDIEADRPVDARDRIVRKAGGLEPLRAFGLRPLRAERSDVEHLRLECCGESRIIDALNVSEGQYGGLPVEP